MRKHGLMVLVAGLLMSFAGNSTATTIPYMELYTPGVNYLMNADGTGQHKTHTWLFDITDNAGWGTPGQLFDDGIITLVVEDDGNDSADKATFTFEAGTGLTETNINAAAWSGFFEVDSSAFADGLITATLTATTGDFYFRSAELTAESNSTEATPVPEPSSVVLLGAGLGAMAFWRKKRNT